MLNHLRVKKKLILTNEKSRPGIKLDSLWGLVYHYVGNPGQSKDGVRAYFEQGHYASAHFIIDDKGIVQIIPLDEVAWHAGAPWWNRNTIGIEMCHDDWTGALSRHVWDRAVYLGAALCYSYGINPQENIVRHYDITGKLCPKWMVEHEADWLEFREEIAEELEVLCQ